MDWVFGFFGSSLVAGIAFWKRSLSGSGFFAAVITGTLLYALGSIAWFGTLLAFFISSSLLSKWKQSKKATAESGYEKTGRRDAGQVFANGGLAVFIVVANSLWPHSFWWYGFIGVMAAVNSDTWATEIGGLSHKQPRSILNGKLVPKGTSGGVSGLGLLASVVGGMFIGFVAWIFVFLFPNQIGTTIVEGSKTSFEGLLLLGGIAGIFGSLVDSYIGARWQVMYQCQNCGKEIERTEHCGTRAQFLRGLPWMNNDTVNFISAACSAILAILIGKVG